MSFVNDHTSPARPVSGWYPLLNVLNGVTGVVVALASVSRWSPM